MKQQVFMVGTGGQGILLLAKALAQIAVRRGLAVISSETHGMAMRGGTVTANLKIGSFASPLIPAHGADILIGLEAGETKGYLHMLKEGGISAVNSAQTGGFTHTIDATALALQAGQPAAANMIMLGFVLKLFGFDMEETTQIMQEISPPQALADNLKAITIGFEHSRA